LASATPHAGAGRRFCPPCGSAVLQPHHDELPLVAEALDVGDAGGLDELAEAGEAVVARIELGQLLDDVGADAAEIGPAIVVGDRVVGAAHRPAPLPLPPPPPAPPTSP